jgi:pimeloyl-ACP methyl ester carboxylesterase
MRGGTAGGRHQKARVLAGAAAGLGGLVAVRALVPAGTPRTTRYGRGDPARAIATLEAVRIGGSSQWILERSADVGNPILLYLHGGPGTSQLTANRRATRQLEHCFTVVNWDQRGAGKSFRAISDDAKMTIGQFVEDTRELTEYLLRKFGQQRLILVGHSWGTVIGALTAARYPELFHCYVGIGQVARPAEGERLSYQWTLEQARARGSRRAIRALETMGPPPYPGDWLRSTIAQRAYLARFGGEVHGNRAGAAGLVLSGVLWSREYTLADRVNVFRGIHGSMRLLWPQLMATDLFTSVPELLVPVFFLEGRYDREAPAAVAERYFAALRAPAKELIWFDESAHLPNSEQRDLFSQIMIGKVRPLATGSGRDRARAGHAGDPR